MPDTKKKRYTCYLPGDLWSWVEEEAARRRVPTSIVVREALFAKMDGSKGVAQHPG